MLHLIDKDALVAEIERRRNECINSLMTEQVYTLNDMLDFIDTLEVKEVDLEKEVEKYAYSLPHSVTGTTSHVSDIKAPIAREFGVKHDEYVEQIAEHFYELGLKEAYKNVDDFINNLRKAMKD